LFIFSGGKQSIQNKMKEGRKEKEISPKDLKNKGATLEIKSNQNRLSFASVIWEICLAETFCFTITDQAHPSLSLGIEMLVFSYDIFFSLIRKKNYGILKLQEWFLMAKQIISLKSLECLLKGFREYPENYPVEYAFWRLVKRKISLKCWLVSTIFKNN